MVELVDITGHVQISRKREAELHRPDRLTDRADMKQAKQAKVATGQTIRDKAKERAALNRDVVKPVFASPFTVPW